MGVRIAPTGHRAPGLLARALLACALLSGAACGRRPDVPPPPASPKAASSEAGYLAPPRALSVRSGRDGTLTVTGAAPPRSTVAVMSPEGERMQVSADAQGVWRLRLPASPRPRLYAISAMLAGRTVHAEGALITAPGALTPAVTVRAGYAASPLGPDRPTAIASVDYDPSGFIAVAGSAPPHAELTLVVDGSSAAVGQADGAGRYALLAANRRLGLGPHQLQVRAPDGAPAREVTLDPPVALAAPYQAWPGPQGWRVEWALNGGGVQTTLILR